MIKFFEYYGLQFYLVNFKTDKFIFNKFYTHNKLAMLLLIVIITVHNCKKNQFPFIKIINIIKETIFIINTNKFVLDKKRFYIVKLLTVNANRFYKLNYKWKIKCMIFVVINSISDNCSELKTLFTHYKNPELDTQIESRNKFE